MRHRRDPDRDGLRHLAPVRVQGEPGPAAARRDRLGRARPTAGASFTKPAVAHEFTHWDMGDEAANPVANGQARYESCQAADGTLGGCEGPEPKQSARDCGDGPFVCQTGYVFGRVNSAPRNAADPVAGEGDELYVVVEATVPGTRAADRHDVRDDRAGHREPGLDLLHEDRERRANVVAVDADRSAAEGQPVLPGHRRERRQAARRLAGHRASTPRRAPTAHWSTVPFENQQAGESARQPSRAPRACSRSTRARRTVGRAGRRLLASSVGVQAELGAVRQPRHPVLRGLQLHLRRRVEGADDLGGRSEHRSGNRPALHERRRHGRLRGLPDAEPAPARHRRAAQTRRPNAGGLDQNIWGLVIG